MQMERRTREKRIQKLIAKLILRRDEELECISCPRRASEHDVPQLWHAGHFSDARFVSTRYNLYNIYKQCGGCNYTRTRNSGLVYHEMIKNINERHEGMTEHICAINKDYEEIRNPLLRDALFVVDAALCWYCYMHSVPLPNRIGMTYDFGSGERDNVDLYKEAGDAAVNAASDFLGIPPAPKNIYANLECGIADALRPIVV